jgi:hypothetical protein
MGNKFLELAFDRGVANVLVLNDTVGVDSKSLRDRVHAEHLCSRPVIAADPRSHAKRPPPGGYVLTAKPPKYVLERTCPVATSQELAQLSKSSTGKVNANTGHLTCEADATHNTGLRELAVYTDSLVSDGGQSVEANCFRARNNRERIAPGATCSIAPASSVVYS